MSSTKIFLEHPVLKRLGFSESEAERFANMRAVELEMSLSEYFTYFKETIEESYEIYFLAKREYSDLEHFLFNKDSFLIGFSIDENLKITRANNVFFENTLWTEEDVIGQPISRFFKEKEAQAYFQSFFEENEKRDPTKTLKIKCNDEIINTSKLAVSYGFHLNGQAVFSAYYKGPGANLIENTLKENRSTFFINKLPILLWSAREDGKIDFLNNYGAETFGLEPDSEGFYSFYDTIHPDDLKNIEAARDTALTSKDKYVYEQRLWVPSENEYKYYRVTSSPIYDEEQGITKWYGAAHSIDHLISIQKELEISQNRNSILMNNLPGVVYQCLNQDDWPMLFITEGIERLTGIPAHKFTNGDVNFNDLIHRDYQGEIWAEVQSKINSGKSFEITYPLTLTEQTIWIWEQGRAFINKKGQTIIEGLMLDISSRINAERQLKESNLYIQNITSAMPNILFVVDLKTRKLEFTNPRFEEVTGYSTDEVNAFEEGPFSIIETSDRSLVNKVEQQVTLLNEGEIVEFEFKAKTKNNGILIMNSRVRSFEYNKNKKVTKALVIAEDVTAKRETEDKLKESEANNDALLNGTLHAFYLFDKDFRILSFNKVAKQEALEYLNIRLEKGLNFPDFLPEELAYNFKESAKIALSGEIYDSVKQFDVGTIQGWYRVIFNPVKNAAGEISGFVYSSLELTKLFETELKLKEQETLLKSINQNIQDGIYRREVKGEIIYVNDAFARMFGFEDSSDFLLHGMGFNMYANPKDRVELAKRVKSTNELNNVEIQFIKRNGDTFWGLLSSRYTQEENNKHYYDGSIRDITDLKAIREELIEAKKNAEEMNKLKSSFLANMSHEIRTPINGILGLSQLMEQEDSIDSIKSHVELLKISGDRLLKTITSILDLSRLESSKPDFALIGIEFNSLLAGTKDMFKVLADKSNINLVYNLEQTPIYVLAEENILYQILNNLIGNAIKFTKAGEVYVSTSTIIKSKQEFLELQIKDTGIGISKEFITKVFEPFQQESQGHSRAFEGSGLGLSIAKKYTNLLGGDLEVSSELGKGSTFTLTLPVKHH